MTLVEGIVGRMKIPPRPSVVGWAEEHLEFPPRVSPHEAGPFRTQRRPYMRAPLEAFADPGVNDLVLCWGAQLGKTTIQTVGLGYRLHHDNLPCLWVMANDRLARSFSETKWQPLVDANPILAAHKPENLDRYKTDEMHFDTMTLNFVGSNSPTNLSSRSAGIVIQDECGKFMKATLEEASAMDLADLRTKDFNLRALRVKASTPTTAEHEFWRIYLQTDQRHFYLRCLHCGEMYLMEHGRRSLRWAPEAKLDNGMWSAREVERTTRYHCPHCDGPHDDAMKMRQLLGETEWRQHSPHADKRARGFHLNSFYSPNVPFGTMALEFLHGHETFSLQDYYNGWLALPWENRVFSVSEKDVLALRRGGFRMKKIPVRSDEIHFLVLTADPGDSQTHWMVSAIGEGGETWLVDWGTVLSVEDLREIRINASYECADGVHMVPIAGIVDSGDRAMRIYDFCRSSRGFFHPSKGSDAAFGTWGSTQPKSHPELTLYTYTDFQAKMELYEGRIAKRLPPMLHIPENAGPELIDGLSGQTLIIKRDGRSTIRKFKKLPNDHLGDCAKLAQLAWWILRPQYEDPEGEENPKETENDAELIRPPEGDRLQRLVPGPQAPDKTCAELRIVPGAEGPRNTTEQATPPATTKDERNH